MKRSLWVGSDVQIDFCENRVYTLMKSGQSLASFREFRVNGP